MIKFLDLKAINEQYRGEIDAAIQRVLDSGWYLLGQEGEAFEQEFAAYCGAAHCLGVANGLDALILILMAYIELGQMEAGDEVIVSANTYIASILAISRAGLKPVLVEPDEQTYNIDPGLIEAAITERTRAYLPGHLYGQCADMDPINEIAIRHGLKVIEDAAQAHGATYRGRKTGSLGDAAGLQLLSWQEPRGPRRRRRGRDRRFQLAEVIQALRNYGSHEKYHKKYKGMNSRLDELQAAILRVKLRNLDADTKKRCQVAFYYLSELSAIQHKSSLILPHVASYGSHVWHLFVIRHSDRDALAKHLAEQGIQTMIHYPVPPHQQQAYLELHELSLPIAEATHREVLSLPISPVMDLSDTSRIVAAITSFSE